MLIKIGNFEFTEVWDRVLYKKLSQFLENEQNLRLCHKYCCQYILLEDFYNIELEDIVK